MTQIPRHSLPFLVACAISFAPAAALADDHEAEPPAIPTPLAELPPPPPAPVSAAVAYAPPIAYAAPLAPLSYSASELPPEDEGPYLPKEGPRPRYGMRKAGMVLTFVGLGIAALGGITLGACASAKPGHSDVYGDFPRQLGMGLGGVMLVGGGVSILTGIPLWAVGSASIPDSRER